jgi:hypothetical protein
LASPHVQHRAFLLPAITIAGDGSGRSVYRILTRHPAVSAAAIASLDHISNGRAVLGIGAGHSGTKNVGLSKSRAKDLTEGVVFIKALLRGEPAGLGTATALKKKRCVSLTLAKVSSSGLLAALRGQLQ